MIRKLVFLVIVLIISFMLTSVVFAQNNMDSDNRYIRCPVGMGVISYIDTSSVVVNEYQPPKYIISINAIKTVKNPGQDRRVWRIRTYKFMYEYAQRKMYLYSPGQGDDFKDRYMDQMKYLKKPIDNSIDWNSDWKYISPDVYYGSGTSDVAVAGEIAFAIAYNLKFHGEKYRIYQDGFYAKLPNAMKIRNQLYEKASCLPAKW